MCLYSKQMTLMTTSQRPTTNNNNNNNDDEEAKKKKKSVSVGQCSILKSRISCCRDAVPKQCCGLGSPPVRWSILGVGIVGLVCAAAGALLGALRATGRDHLAVSLLMIGKTTYFFCYIHWLFISHN